MSSKILKLTEEIDHLRRGIEAYRANWKASLCAVGVCDDPDEQEHDEEDWADASTRVITWEWEDAKRNEA